MSLQSLLDLSSSRDTMKQGVSEERLKENMDMLKDKLVLDTKNISVLKNTYKL